VNRRRIAARAAVALVLGFFGVTAVSWFLGGRLVAPVQHAVPLPLDLSAQIVSIPGEGHAIAGWWIDRGGRSPVVLLLHAVRADRSTMVPRARLLLAEGFSVLLVDLQAHGETPGESITMGWRESSDARAALAWIRKTAPRRRVGVVGCSLGGAAVLLGPQPVGFDAVVLEAVYPHLGRAVENRIRIRLGPLAPVLAPLLLAQLPLRLHVDARDLEPIRGIGPLEAPVLVIAGSRDEHTTLDESRELFAAAAPPKELWVVDGARHEDLLAYDPAGYAAHVVPFLRRYLRSG
jgi:uncharacterized protein